ncbi:lytic transglycosylase domain-containing protein [Photobacterium damselae]|uniref:lytic transglycosylase domain-containing protein n=1 Tax=Photobacterium damselae TaxID=38293 RepID=UPI00254398B1
MFDISLLSECLYNVHPQTMQQIIKNESGGNRLAINVNVLRGKPKPKYNQPKTVKDAIRLANYYIKKGHSVDLGLAQINSNNLKYFNVTVEDMFEPCKNINVGSKILYSAYQRAKRTTNDQQSALLKALSIYNTGNMSYGFRNGYVNRYKASYSMSINEEKKAYKSPTTININELYK